MSKIVQYLKEVNLDNDEYLQNYIWNSETKELLILIDYLRNLIEEDYTIKQYSPFTFVPNDDLSGSGGCGEISCKITRATRFAVFSTMYADDVYIQLNLITSAHYSFEVEEIDCDDDGWFNFRNSLHCDIAILNTYSMLIEAGIVHITPPKKSYCKECFQKEVLGIKHSVNIEDLKGSLINNAELVVDGYDKDLNMLTFKVNNMDEFFPEHGEVFQVNKEQMIYFPEVIRKSGKIITDKSFVRNFLDEFIDSEFASTCYYASYCKTNNAKFITTKLSDSMLMGLTQRKNQTNFAFDHYKALPKYDLPFIGQTTIEKALHLREIEGESFNKYRIALNKAVVEQCKSDSSVEWTQIYDDILYPAFNELDMKLKNIKNGFYKNTFANIILIGSVVSAGVYTGIVPNNIPVILESIGGVSSVIATGNKLVDKFTNKNEPLQENDYYFLWRLKKLHS